MNSQSESCKESQRIQVTRETQGAEPVVRITVERYHEVLGWYTAGALCLPLCQLPLLEQALGELSPAAGAECVDTACPRKIIPFPGPTLVDSPAIAETGS